MTREHERAALPRATRFPLLLLALLAGLFAMHGLGPHDQDHSTGHVPTAIAVVTPDTDHDVHDASGPEPSTGQADRTHEDPTDQGGGLGECLALLGLLFALVMAVLVSARTTRPMVVLRRVRARLLLLGRPPDPPCLHRLSIMRC